MNDIKYGISGAFVIDPAMLDANINVIHELTSHMLERLARDTDGRITGLIEKRLGGAVVKPEALTGRLQRIITQGTGYETLLLDGVPFARVYEATIATKGLLTTAKQVIEELEG